MTPRTAAFKVARTFEKEAQEFVRTTQDKRIFGMKCWYGDARLIEQGAPRVLIGLNPGGGKISQERDQMGDYLTWPYTRANYNAWIDDRHWETRGPSHQAAVQEVFKSLYGAKWEEKLRQTACFNVVPFRTPNASDISKEVWEWGAKWSTSVLEHIAPKLILCNGNGRKSPWSVLCSAYQIKCDKEVPIGATGSTASLKSGIITSGTLKGSRVIGLPFLARFGWPETFLKVKRFRPLP